MLEHVTTHSPWVFYTVAVLCVLLVGVSKAGFGGGVGVVATPVLALVTPPQTAAGILLPLLIACDLFSLGQYWRNCDMRNFKRLLPGAVAGIAVGTVFMLSADKATVEEVLRKTIGVISLAFVVWQTVKARWLRHAAEAPPSQGRGGWFWGVLSGFASMLAHQGGPPVTVYLLPQRLHRERLLGTMVCLFAAVNFVKLAPYAALGMLNTDNLKLAAVLMPAAPFGVWLGVWLQRRMEQRVFERMIYVILTLTAAQLLTGFNVIDWAGVAMGR